VLGAKARAMSESDTVTITNALTIDVEDYFQVSALAPHIDRASWDERPCRVERNVGRLLELLAQHRTRATFFTLGWIAKRYPQLVREIVAGGHELASHGYAHLRASEQDPIGFRHDVKGHVRMLQPAELRALTAEAARLIGLQPDRGGVARNQIPLALQVRNPQAVDHVTRGDLDDDRPM